MNVLRFHFSSVPDAKELLAQAANDSHGRVRMTAAVTASYLPRKLGLETLESADDKNESAIYQQTYGYAREVLNRKAATSDMKDRKVAAPAHLSAEHSKLFVEGSEVYAREGHCITCHQGNGNGLPDSGFPPLAGAKWVTGDPDRLIKVTLKGLMGPMEVKGRKYPGQVPMTPFEHMLNDQEIASVLTYVRNSFGNKASPIESSQVAKVRGEVKDFVGLYSPDALLKEHPIK